MPVKAAVSLWTCAAIQYGLTWTTRHGRVGWERVEHLAPFPEQVAGYYRTTALRSKASRARWRAGASSPSGAAHRAPHTPGPLAAPARLGGGGRGPPGPPVLAGGRTRATSSGTMHQPGNPTSPICSRKLHLTPCQRTDALPAQPCQRTDE